MAEPYGILAVCTTSFKVARALHDLIVRLREVPNELLALSNEVCNLTFVLDSVAKALHDDERSGASKLSNVGPMLFQARVKLDSLDKLISKWAKIDAWGDSVQIGRIDRFFWLKEKSKVWELQKQLREIRQGLIVLLGAGNASALAQLSVGIQNLYAETVRTSESQSRSQAETQKFREMISRRMDPIEEIQRNSQDGMKLLQNLCLSLAAKPAQETQQDPTEMETSSPGDPASIPLSSTRQEALQDAEEESTLERELASEEAPLAIPVSWQQGRKLECSSDCKCSCHTQQNVQAYSSLGNILGRLFLSYSGSSILRKPCDLSRCSQQNAKSIRLTYFFPRWFLNHVVSTTFSTSRLGTPTLNLKVRRIVPETNRLFALCSAEGVDGIQRLFVNREASPDDIHHRGGWTPLHFAVDHGCVEVCKLLLNSGADATWEDNTGTSPAQIAWRNVLQLPVPPQTAKSISRLFSKEDYLQDRRFNRLHKLVNELENGNLGAELTSGTVSDIDGRDADGWTALHWAARRGNSEAVVLLLAHGADPRLTTWNDSRSALHLAALSSSALCVQQILQWRRGNAIVDLELRDGYGCTPLHAATESNSAAATAFLISSSADLNARENFGFTPLLYAVGENKVEAATLLLRHGADYKIANKLGGTVLHIAANIATVPMLVILTKARMRGLDLEARDSEGLTVAELVARRDGEVPEAFTRAFDRLTRSIIDEDFEAGSWTSLSSSGSWHSIEDASWYEAEASAMVEADLAEEELEQVETLSLGGGESDSSTPRIGSIH